MQPPAGVWAGGVLVAGLDFAFHDPFVISHLHAVHLEIDHVDGFVGGAINSGFGTVHAWHVIGIQKDLTACFKRRFAGVFEFLVDDPFVIGDRVTAIGGGIAHRIRGRIERARDRGFGTVHAGHMVGLQDDLFAYLIPGVLGFLDACWWWAAVWVVI